MVVTSATKMVAKARTPFANIDSESAPIMKATRRFQLVKQTLQTSRP